MPSDMRLQCPSEDTPPSTRPPSVASSGTSTSGFPHRSTSMDSLHTNSSTSEKPSGEEYIPTRLIRATPKANSNAMQFVKTGPANLHKSAKEQMKKAEVVKSLRKTSLQEEEEEWQSSSPVDLGPNVEGSDWQTNLDKWKCSRRKRNEDVLERVIEVKKNEQDTDFSKTRRKSKTFSEMREDKNKRGRRYNLVVHDDDNNDLTDLGLTSGKNGSSLSEPPDEGEVKYADTKSDAGFCTGSDTGSDGVFAEDSISDTSSAMGDKREIHDSLLESGTTTSTTSKEVNDVVVNGHTTISITKRTTLSHEYTYDKAIEDYKTFAENSVKKRTSSITSLSSNASGSKEETERPFSISSRGTSPVKKLEDKVFEPQKIVAEPKFLRRERNQPKVDIDKRRSMFELRDIDNQTAKRVNKSTIDLSTSLRTKVASFENLNSEVRPKGVTPPRDTKFKEKLASFSQKEKDKGEFSGRKKTPERDQNFYQKLQSFSRLEESTKPSSEWKGSGSIPRNFPERTSSWKTTSSHTRLSPNRSCDSRVAPPPTPLKDRIASFENLSPIDSSPKRRELSVSMENLNKRSSSFSSDGGRSPLLTSSQSVSNLFRRAPSTPFMVVEVEESQEEKPCVKRSVTRDYEVKSPEIENDSGKVEGVTTKAGNSLDLVGGIEILQTSETSTSESASFHKLEFSPPSNRTETHTPKVAPRTLPEAPKPRNKSLPKTPEVMPSRRLPETPTTNAYRILPDLPPQVPAVPPPREPEETSGTVEEPFNRTPEDPPPPVPPPRVPTIEVPYNASPAISHLEKSSGLEASSEKESSSSAEDSRNDTSSPSPLEYGDHDIDEVIDNYEHLSEAITIGDGGCHPDETQATEMQQQENFYEKIVDEDPLYENIYEKVSEEDEGPVSENGAQDHHYQTLDEVNTEKANLPSSAPPTTAIPSLSPALPLKNKNLSVYEVLDVTWTEDLTSSPALPPSVSPPPPPPEEDDEEEEEVKLREGSKANEIGVLPFQHPNAPSSTVEDKGYNSFNCPQSTKQDLRKKMSDFLGTKPHVEEEVTLQPPPDVSELLRQEREAERLIVQKQASLARESPLLEFDLYGASGVPGRTKYTWEDRMKADGPDDAKHDLDESTDTLEFHTKLAELEQEMVKHDRSMLQRVQGPPLKEEPLFMEANAYTEQPQQFCTRKSPSETVPPFPEPVNSSANKPPAQTAPNVPPPNQSSHLPFQAFYTAPLYTEVESGIHSSRYTGSQEKIYNSESTTCSQTKRREMEEPLPPKSLPQVPPPIPRKQSILALSAIPKPRLTDNDSWIMKRKAEAGKKDYSKHWLIQEAEQRRLEQQERISRPIQLPLSKPASELLGTSPNHNHFQNIKSYHSSTPQHTSQQLSFPLPNVPPALSPLSPNKPVPTTNGMLPPMNELPNKHVMNGPPNVSSTSSNNLWKKQTKTYQPPQPSPPSGTSKPLPDAIINSLTQRVNNKNKISGSSRPTVYNSGGSYRAEDNYHDYMNTDTFNPNLNSNNNNNNTNLVGSPVAQSSPGLNHLPSGNQSAQLSEDQRLLSVSGKKKCSHCGEELGRGAAMIIESLRLFYHIPCFKCCVCGTQLGNGTSGADVRVRNHKLHCHNCYSNDEGMKFSKV